MTRQSENNKVFSTTAVKAAADLYVFADHRASAALATARTNTMALAAINIAAINIAAIAAPPR